MRAGARVLGVILLGAATWPVPARAQAPYDSGGPLMPEQAAFDVLYNDLALRVQPADSSIDGSLRVWARIASPTEWLVLDLDEALRVGWVSAVPDRAGESPVRLRFVRRGGRIWIEFPAMRQPGDVVAVEIGYGGRPRIAPNPPWDGGFIWATTPAGDPWIATAVQQEGADLWWPVKDHPSDEPDSMALHITVPEPLVVASNGRLRDLRHNDDGTVTYDWFVSTPINSYNVALNIAPYRLLEAPFESVSGDTFPIELFVLPEDVEKGRALLPEIEDHLRFFERNLGPYPFRRDKYGVAQTPYLGMEHQSIIAYGANFDDGAMTGGVDWGFDALHQHEASHEWWGNLVTNADWKDMWLHEGFASYMQPLYLEQTQGREAYDAYMASIRPRITNAAPVAPRASRSSGQMYGGDIYFKGAWILHTLRYLIGDDAMALALRRMAYPDPALESTTDGRAARFATTDDFRHIAEAASGMDLDWFFEVYLRQPVLPRLEAQRTPEGLDLRWVVPDALAFPMPVEIEVDGERRRIEMPDGTARVSLPLGAAFRLDPGSAILKDESGRP
ncbi:MAG: M1 family metallopeptidase [Gemmatimonadota bacterium]